jgi:NADH-quinone oxidoreductase subunit N
MAAELLYGLLPAHLVLALLVALMLLEIFAVRPVAGRVAFVGLLLAAMGAVLHQLSLDFSTVILPGEMVVDRFAQWSQLVVLGTGVVLGLTWPANTSYKSWLLATASVFGAVVMMNSAGFAALFIGIELLSLPAFALMVHGVGTGAATDGAFRYLLLSAVASAMLLFGVSLSYGLTGSLSIDAFAASVGGGSALETAALLLVLSGLFLKAAVFPFHGWAPEAYGSAPLPVTALLASLVKGAVVLSLARVLGGAVFDANVAVVITVLALMSIAYGNLAALAQSSFRRLLAYSSIAHAGYMIFALLDSTGSRGTDLLWYVGIYSVATLLACASLAVLSRDDDALCTLDGGFAAHPVASLVLAACVLSLAGLPPFPGFFAKLMVFQSVVASGYLFPAVLAFAGSFLGLTVYVGIVLRLFRSERTEADGIA